MAVSILQFLLALGAGFLVFQLWRRVTAASRPIFWLVTIGTLVRAIGGLLGFWISYLHLPLARSLQLGRGLWFFGVDAVMYFDFSAAAAARGPIGILYLDKGLPSPFFLQVLAAAILLFGTVSSVAILLNVAAYLASCRIILSFDRPEQHRFVVFAIAALSLAPSVVVWSLQPMKDVVFLFLVIAFFGAARLWQQLWRDTTAPLPAARSLLLCSAAMAVMLYGISGIRWYFAFAVLLSALPFLFLAILPAQRRLAAAASALLLFVVLTGAFFAGGSSYVPDAIHGAVRSVQGAAALPKTLVGLVQNARRGFDQSGGATLIGAGGAIRKLDRNVGAKETSVAATPWPQSPHDRAGDPADFAVWKKRMAARKANPELAPQQAKAGTPSSTAQGTKPPEVMKAPVMPAPVTAHKTNAEPGQAKAVTASAVAEDTKAPKVTKAPESPSSVKTGVHGTQPAKTASVAKAPTVTNTTESPLLVKTAPHETQPVKTASVAKAPTVEPKTLLPATRRAAKAPVITPTPPPAATSLVVAHPAAVKKPQASPAEPEGPAASVSTVVMPGSTAGRLLAGTAAVVLPQWVARKLGVLDVRGGRGLWLFVEVDTIFFDIVLVFAIISVFRSARQRTLRAPIFWMILFVTIVVGGSLAYTVSNFGTLFRHRDMFLIGLALLPVAAAGSRPVQRVAAVDPDNALGEAAPV